MGDTWPQVQYRERTWPPPNQSVDRSWSNRRRRANRGRFRQAIVPDIAAQQVVLEPGLSQELHEVTDELTRFDAQYVGGAPFSAVLLRSESAASSQIEQLTANARRISLARLGDESRPNATLIAKNTTALEAALKLAHQLHLTAVLQMHHALLDDSDPDHAGKLRDVDVWIGGDSPVTAMFVPPAAPQVPRALEDLFTFMHRRDLPTLAQAAIAHAQFETIHPFTDGNGRTGRALVSAMLRSRGVTRNFTVPLSSGLLTSTTDYFAALTAYRRGDPTPIIAQFVDAARRAMANVQVLLIDIQALEQRILGTAQRVTKNLRAVARLCTTEPAFTAEMVAALGVPTSSVYTIINRLVEHHILRSEHKIHGQTVWSVRELTDALDNFATRAGRRL